MIVQRCVATLALLFTSLVGVAPAQTPTTGTWSIEPGTRAGQVHFELRVDSGTDSHSDHSSDVDASTLGLSTAQLQSSGGHVAFTVSREAGSFACDGWLAGGKGGGTAVFTPSSAYLAKMRDLGYDNISPSNQLTAAMIDLTTAYVASLQSTGYPHLPFDKLVAFRALGIDEGYLRTMRSAFGNTAIGAEDVIAMRALHVTGDYITQMRAAGFAVSTPRNAIELQALHVDVAFAKDLAAAGYPHLTSEQLVQLRAMHIDAAYIKQVRDHGIKNPSVEELVRLKAMNII